MPGERRPTPSDRGGGGGGGGGGWRQGLEGGGGGGGGLLGRLSASARAALDGGQDARGQAGSDEEKQGLLDYASSGLQNVAERAGGSLGSLGGHMGGKMNTAMQVAAIGRERWIAFFALLGVGCLLMAISLASLPLIVLAPHRFAAVFTTGSLCWLGSLAALKGRADFAAHLASPERRSLSLGYVGSVAATLWASLWYRSTLLTMVFSGLQISALLWFFVSYIPGGSTALGYVQDCLCGAARHACCDALFRRSGGSVPL